VRVNGEPSPEYSQLGCLDRRSSYGYHRGERSPKRIGGGAGKGLANMSSAEEE